jgi:hypothetical protein
MEQCWTRICILGLLVSPALLNAQPSLSFNEYTIPTANSQPGSIATGPDGALWFTEPNNIGRITTAGAITEYLSPTTDPPPASIAGIDWNQHFSALHIAITNTTDEDYRDMDILFKPNSWIREAKLLNSATVCTLYSVGGNVIKITQSGATQGTHSVTPIRAGDFVDVYDSSGDPMNTIATEGGYRLRCDKVPSRYTINMLVVAVSVPEHYLSEHTTTPLATDEVNMNVIEMKAPESPFDILGPRPSPETVRLKGRYTRGIKPHTIDQTVPVLGIRP